MSDRRLHRHLWVSTVLLIGATVLLHAANQRTKVPLRQPLKDLPSVLGDWHGVDLPLTDHIIAALSVDDYLQRSYTDARGNEVQLYVGYYGSQRSGELIHSPKNCLPGAGWEWVRKGILSFQPAGSAPIVMNDFRIAKGVHQDLVLYWYHGRGRAIADEYQAKFWMIADAAIRRRTDGSLVRILIPIRDRESDARELGVRFLRAFYPHLHEFIPD